MVLSACGEGYSQNVFHYVLKRIYNALRVLEFVKRRWLMLIIFIQSQRLPFLNSVFFSIGGLMEYYSGKYLPLVCAEKITLLT